MQILCILIAMLIVMSEHPILAQTQVSEAEAFASLPPELLFEGKPVNPECINLAAPLLEGESWMQNLKECSAKTTVEYTDGYWKSCRVNVQQKFCNFMYRYLGTDLDGRTYIETHADWNKGDISGVGILSRIDTDSSTFNIKPDQTFERVNVHENKIGIAYKQRGNHCQGGVVAADVKDGRLHYSYGVTPKLLHNMYSPKNSEYAGFEAAQDCMALIYNVDDKVDHIELIRSEAQLENDLTCQSFSYREQVKAHGTSMTEDETRAFFKMMEQTCIYQGDGE